MQKSYTFNKGGDQEACDTLIEVALHYHTS